MRPPKAERERMERELAETAAHLRAIHAAVDYVIGGLDSPDPMTWVRCAATILRESNKAREREIRRRLFALEDRLDELRRPSRLALV